MKTIADERQNAPQEDEEHIDVSVSRLKKHIYVLPSGRTLKVIEYDENVLVRNTA